MFRITCDRYTLSVAEDFPTSYNEYHRRAKLAEVFENEIAGTHQFFLSVAQGTDWPFLLLMQKYSPGSENGFHPGAVIIPETHLLFVGAGERLLAYRLDPLAKLWEEHVMAGFWAWERYQHYVVMSAELELAVWDISGKKLWSTFVEPPWDYTIADGTVHLNVMGKKSSFLLQEGPTSLFQ